MTLQQELLKYRQELTRLLQEGQEGRFVLIQGDQLIGVWENEEEALRQGYDRFLMKPFLVKAVRASEKPHYFSRNLSR